MGGVKRQAVTPVEGLQIVHVDSPAVRRKYEDEAAALRLELGDAVAAIQRRAEALEKELVAAKGDYARAYAEGKTLRAELAMAKAAAKPGEDKQALGMAHNEARKLRAALDASAAEVASLRGSLERARARLAATAAPAQAVRLPSQPVSLESLKAKAGAVKKLALPERAALFYAICGGVAFIAILGLIRLFKKG